MNWEFMKNYFPLYQKAALLTIRIGLMGITAAILLGLICMTIQYYKVPFLRRIITIYIEISRNTPLLIQLFFIYYGLPKVGIQTDAATCGVAGLAFQGGSYMAEAFRSGMEAIPASQEESAYSLGLSKMQTMLARIGLEEKADNFPRQLSGGQKQRVAIIRELYVCILRFCYLTRSQRPLTRKWSERSWKLYWRSKRLTTQYNHLFSIHS